MRVILNDHVPNLGERGDVLEVKPGYARNFLIPKGLAYEATPANVARFQAEQKRWEQRQAKEKASAAELAEKLSGVELTFTRRAGEGDTLYGSVTAADIAEALEAKGFVVDRRKVALDHHIKRLGTYTVELHLHKDVNVPVVVHVKPQGANE
ncbi:MAG: 50S ribosomal protein L9 [Thermoanaerobaculaceae bacterium]